MSPYRDPDLSPGYDLISSQPHDSSPHPTPHYDPSSNPTHNLDHNYSFDPDPNPDPNKLRFPNPNPNGDGCSYAKARNSNETPRALLCLVYCAGSVQSCFLTILRIPTALLTRIPPAP